MNLKRGKIKTKKYVSIMMVPHNSDKVKTWKVSNLHVKFFSILALLLVILLTLSGYLALVTQENRQLRDEQSNLYSFFLAQQEIVKNNIAVITEVEDLDNVSKEKLMEFTFQVQDITTSYIEKEMKNFSVSRSAAATNPTTTFVGKVSELRALLSFLEDADIKEDELFDELDDTKEKLASYLNHLPTLWPTEGIIESEYGNRLHPIYKRFINHTGVDIGGASGTPIYAAATGTVIAAGKNGGYGYCVDIDHGNGLVTRYAHCKKILVRKWQDVKVGDKIAAVGQTGTATGPHLHFEIMLNRKQIDPVMFIGTAP